MKPSTISFKDKTAMIVCHDSMPGPPHETLRDYLLKHNIYRLIFIGHVNQYVIGNPIKRSYLKLYEDGVLVKKIEANRFNLPEAFNYIVDFLLTCYWLIKYSKRNIHLFVGLANLNAIVGILFQKIGWVSHTVYYVIDYIPQRFNNEGMNAIYHYLDKVCAERSNATWNYGLGMIKAREEKWHKVFPRQIHTPHGVEINKKHIKNFLKFNPTELVYLGTLYEQQGLQLIIEALPKIINKIKSIHLTIIGIGPFRNHLEERIKDLNIQNNISFVGFIEKASDVDLLLAKSALGIATYKNDMGFVNYTEPGKVKRYLSCAVPVLITSGTPLSEDIDKNLCGIVSKYDVNEVSRKIIAFISNKKEKVEFRKHAISYAKQQTWEEIYTRAFHFTL